MSARENGTANVVVYTTPNASSPLKPLSYHGVLYSTGQKTMWECPDFAALPSSDGLFFLKYSGEGREWGVIGSFDADAI